MGTFFERYPRYGPLISINKVRTGTTDAGFNLRKDWNSLLSADLELVFIRYFPRYFPAAKDLHRYLADLAVMSAVRIQFNTATAPLSLH